MARSFRILRASLGLTKNEPLSAFGDGSALTVPVFRLAATTPVSPPVGGPAGPGYAPGPDQRFDRGPAPGYGYPPQGYDQGHDR